MNDEKVKEIIAYGKNHPEWEFEVYADSEELRVTRKDYGLSRGILLYGREAKHIPGILDKALQAMQEVLDDVEYINPIAQHFEKELDEDLTQLNKLLKAFNRIRRTEFKVARVSDDGIYVEDRAPGRGFVVDFGFNGNEVIKSLVRAIKEV